MVEVIINKAEMGQTKTLRKVVPWTRAQAGISTEMLNSVALGS
jgi:hypothetical protein